LSEILFVLSNHLCLLYKITHCLHVTDGYNESLVSNEPQDDFSGEFEEVNVLTSSTKGGTNSS